MGVSHRLRTQNSQYSNSKSTHDDVRSRATIHLLIPSPSFTSSCQRVGVSGSSMKLFLSKSRFLFLVALVLDSGFQPNKNRVILEAVSQSSAPEPSRDSAWENHSSRWISYLYFLQVHGGIGCSEAHSPNRSCLVTVSAI